MYTIINPKENEPDIYISQFYKNGAPNNTTHLLNISYKNRYPSITKDYQS